MGRRESKKLRGKHFIQDYEIRIVIRIPLASALKRVMLFFNMLREIFVPSLMFIRNNTFSIIFSLLGIYFKNYDYTANSLKFYSELSYKDIKARFKGIKVKLPDNNIVIVKAKT